MPHKNTLRRPSQRTLNYSRSVEEKVVSASELPSHAKLACWRIVVDFVRYLAWPAVIILVLYLFYNPLFKLAEQLPLVVANSATISVGGPFNVTLQKQLTAIGDKELIDRLNRLTPDAIAYLLMLNETITVVLEPDKASAAKGKLAFCFYSPYQEDEKQLYRAGLIAYSDGLDPEETMGFLRSSAFSRSSCGEGSKGVLFTSIVKLSEENQARFKQYSYSLTPRGKLAWHALFETVREQLRAPTDSSAPSKSPTK